ncbi:LLM class flavin-dependent oxidoreductase [Burkholderia cepacia]|uniref:LLM class flavin-dependent oxidoreductase n=1 Tax=Burkholderia cepacia TaxID=292 RepID=UPI002AB6B7BD|nr:LLM class flavin-dependent oxidoreductase [Burkholderia cepacia]
MSKRYMHLAAFCSQPGNHVAAWRHPQAATTHILDMSFYKQFAQTAERGLFDLVFLADTLSVAEESGTQAQFTIGHGVPFRADPLSAMAVMASVTERIGLVGTASTSHNEPFNIARRFAFLDHLSGGRIGWNIVTTASPAEALNFGAGAYLAHDERYARAGEFVEVVRKLWDSWDDDAIVNDRVNGVYAAPQMVRRIDHVGRYFSVRGPLNVPRSPQGHPVLFQAGTSPVGRSFAASTADAIFMAAQTREEMASISEALRSQAKQHGRRDDELRLLPGVLVFVGRTEQEAREKQAALTALLLPEVGKALLTELLGIDLGDFDLDAPFPEIDPAQIPGIQSRYLLLRAMAQREHLTLREVLARVASGAGHRIVAGNPEQVADALEDWFRAGLVDGYAVLSPYLPGCLDDFVDLVIPALARRGLVRTAYEGTTLRDHLGLNRPVARGNR